MQRDRKSLLGIVTLLLPLLVLGGLWIKAAGERDYGQQAWQIKITGYDPRDLFYGRYMQFRYDWNMPDEVVHVNKNACMCLTRGDEGTKNPVAVPLSCNAPQAGSCESLIHVQARNRQYGLNTREAAERYYIPEEHAPELDRLFREGTVPFHVELMAHADGRAIVRGLLVDGKPMEEYLRTRVTEAGPEAGGE